MNLVNNNAIIKAIHNGGVINNRMDSIKQLTFIQKLGYSMGNYSYGIMSQMIAFYIVFYGTSVLGISGKLVGTVVSLSVVWDAITDPLMGYISDRTHFKRWGRRHLYILFGCVFMGIFSFLLFTIPPNWQTNTKITLLVLLLLLAKTFLTIYTTPYTALGAELSNDYMERSTIQGFRTAFFLTGIISATGLGLALFFNPTQQYANGQLNPIAYQNMAIVFSSLAIIFGAVCFITTYKKIGDLPKAADYVEGKGIMKAFISMLDAFKNIYFRYVVLAYLFTNIASGIFSTLGLHVYTYTFRLSNTEISTIFGIQFLTCILAQPIWVFISKRLDKKPTVMLGLFISMLGSIYFAILVILKSAFSGSIVAIIPFAIITGLGIAGLFSLPLSMIADTIDVEELNNGQRSEGVYYGLLTLAYKISQGFVIFLLGHILDIINFVPGVNIQSSNVEIVLGMTVSIGSFIGFLVAIFFYSKYQLNQEKILDIQNAIKIKKEQQQIINNMEG